jgi:hypothetical protein
MIKQLNTIKHVDFMRYLESTKEYEWNYLCDMLEGTNILSYSEYNNFTLNDLEECIEGESSKICKLAYTEIKEFMTKNNVEQLLFLN